jgi:hypothetical protein
VVRSVGRGRTTLAGLASLAAVGCSGLILSRHPWWRAEQLKVDLPERRLKLAAVAAVVAEFRGQGEDACA